MKFTLPKIETTSLLLGAFFGALAVLCVAAAADKPAPDAASQQRPSSDLAAKTNEVGTEQVTGIGGVFFKAKDPKAMLAWYRKNLGFPARGSYADFKWRDKDRPDQMSHTAWRIFPTNTTYFGQSTSPLMINYRVANMDRMLEQLRKAGTNIEKIEDYEYGRFAWIIDPEDNRIELWEPKQK